VEHRPGRPEDRRGVLDLDFLAREVDQDLPVVPELLQPLDRVELRRLGGLDLRLALEERDALLELACLALLALLALLSPGHRGTPSAPRRAAAGSGRGR